MVENGLKQRCHVNTNLNEDTFVGIKLKNNDIKINFPLGYHLSDNDKELRQDVIRLMKVLSKYTNREKQLLPNNKMTNIYNIDFPVMAYLHIIKDYMQNGYYTENEVCYKKSRRGKVNWARTIKSQRPFLQNNSFVYLEYMVKDSISDNLSLLSLIHEYFVYESFKKLGWLYTTVLPKKPRLKRFDKAMFSSIIYSKLRQTFNDKHVDLLNSMLTIIKYLNKNGCSHQLYFGTERFEYVWEKLVDMTFGVDDKERYFPKTTWNLCNGIQKDNSPLEPDTIMILDNKIYVLDAKYYKYGVTGIPAHLPPSTSINKQITYGEYISTQQKFKDEFGEDLKVFNAFIMPFNRLENQPQQKSLMKNIGEGTGSWKQNNKEYERVQGILIDTRFLIKNVIKQNHTEIIQLSMEIEKAFNIT